MTIRRFVLWAFAVLIGLVILWLSLGLVLGSSRGLDLTDEGLYLLGADPPSASAAWGWPFGWHTHPLFALVGYDIANFRTLGALILVLSSSWLGWLVARVVRIEDQALRRMDARLLPIGSACIAGLGSLLYYVSMLRTPSYNWLCLVGITVASVGLMLALRQAWRSSAHGAWRRSALPATVSSLAVFLTLPAKPSVLPMFLLFGLLLLALLVDWSTAWHWLAWAVVLLPVWVLLAVVTRVWPLDFVAVLSRALRMPYPDPSQTPTGAVQEALLAPRAAAQAIGEIADLPALLLLGSAMLLALPLVLRRRWLTVRLAGFGAVAVAALGIAGVPIPLVNAEGRPFGLAQPTLTTALLTVLLATVAVSWRLEGREYSRAGQRFTRVQMSVVLAAFLYLMTLVFGFGSDNGIYGQSALAGGLALTAAAVIALGLEVRRDSFIVMLAVLGVTALFVISGLLGGWRFPQRQSPLADQTVSTMLGGHGAHLLLDARTAQALSGLQEQAKQSGWKPGTPMVDVSYTWNPGVVYALGAQAPDSLMLTIFGYPAAHDIAAFHLSGHYLEFPFRDAWVLTTRPDLLDPGARSAVDFTLDRLAVVSGKHLPASFTCIASGDFILWRPLAAGESASDSCGW
ncbi:MAG: hypothetical protein PHU75_02940 [Candidatus Nanopelagicales bacterium]|nr:hypothetical protein [Candidatus Nanopelagicales bacterium]